MPPKSRFETWAYRPSAAPAAANMAQPAAPPVRTRPAAAARATPASTQRTRRLSAAGVGPERDLSLTVAPRKERGPVFRLERGRDVQALRPREEAVLC